MQTERLCHRPVCQTFLLQHTVASRNSDSACRSCLPFKKFSRSPIAREARSSGWFWYTCKEKQQLLGKLLSGEQWPEIWKMRKCVQVLRMSRYRGLRLDSVMNTHMVTKQPLSQRSLRPVTEFRPYRITHIHIALGDRKYPALHSRSG